MIRYALACQTGHEFESWFPSSDAFDGQAARGLVACPSCGSTKVEKQVMAPSLARRDRPAPAPVEAPAAAPEPAAPTPATTPAPPQPVALLGERERQLRAMLKAVRAHVMATAENVGERFPAEARRMHEGEIEHRPIYGEASPPEVKALLEDGIEVHPLPRIADDGH
jgi:hypothetical protein